jgi:hypothetical protein
MLLRFGGALFIVVLVIWLYCLLDAITSNENDVRSLPKIVWVLIVLFTFEVGAVLWLLFGRPRRSTGPVQRFGGTGRYETWQGRVRPAGGADRSTRPAPDDDPEFLAGLGRRANDEHKNLLDQWEADLRRREEDLRRRADERPDTGRDGRESGREASGRDSGEEGSGQPDEPGH